MTVHSTSPDFKRNAARALGDAQLQKALGNVKQGFIDKRQKAAERLPEFEALRDSARDIKNHTLQHLDLYLEAYEEKVTASRRPRSFRPQTPPRRATSSSAMCREAGATHRHQGQVDDRRGNRRQRPSRGHGIAPVETDLGEYIIQLRHELPSHIIAPAVHLNATQVEQDFRRVHTHLDAEARPLRAGAPADRGAQRAPRALPFRRRGHHRREFSGRGNRHFRHRDQRGQRRPHADPAARRTSFWRRSRSSCRRSRM